MNRATVYCIAVALVALPSLLYAREPFPTPVALPAVKEAARECAEAIRQLEELGVTRQTLATNTNVRDVAMKFAENEAEAARRWRDIYGPYDVFVSGPPGAIRVLSVRSRCGGRSFEYDMTFDVLLPTYCSDEERQKLASYTLKWWRGELGQAEETALFRSIPCPSAFLYEEPVRVRRAIAEILGSFLPCAEFRDWVYEVALLDEDANTRWLALRSIGATRDLLPEKEKVGLLHRLRVAISGDQAIKRTSLELEVIKELCSLLQQPGQEDETPPGGPTREQQKPED